MDTKNKSRDLESLLIESAERELGDELDFDRFMAGVVESQKRKHKTVIQEEDSPQLRYNKLYREKPSNRIRFGR